MQNLFAAATEVGVRCTRLIDLTIEELNLSDESVFLDLERVPLSPKAAEFFAEAVDARTEGNVFLTANGAAWKRLKIQRTFKKVRDSLGMDSDVRI